MPRTIHLTSPFGSWRATLEAATVALDGTSARALVRDADAGRLTVDDASGTQVVTFATVGDRVWIGIDGYALEFTADDANAPTQSASADDAELTPPMSATVVRVPVQIGDRVDAGDTLIVLEAMKMELSIRSPRKAVVQAIHCVEGQLVQPGTKLVELADASR